MSLDYKSYMVSQRGQFSVILFGKGPKETALRVARQREGDSADLREVNVETATSYKVELLNEATKSIKYYEKV